MPLIDVLPPPVREPIAPADSVSDNWKRWFERLYLRQRQVNVYTCTVPGQTLATGRTSVVRPATGLRQGATLFAGASFPYGVYVAGAVATGPGEVTVSLDNVSGSAVAISDTTVHLWGAA